MPVSSHYSNGTGRELAAAQHSIEEVRASIGADSLGYLSLEDLLAPFDKPSDYCTACFTGNYPVDAGSVQDKMANDGGCLELNFGRPKAKA